MEGSPLDGGCFACRESLGRARPWTGLAEKLCGVGPGRPALRWLNALGPDGGLDDRPREHKSYLDAFIRLRLRR